MCNFSLLLVVTHGCQGCTSIKSSLGRISLRILPFFSPAISFPSFSPSLSPTKRLLIEHRALSFKLQGTYTMHLKGERSWRYQEAFENVLHAARGYKDTGCPKNNNKEASDRFMAFCSSADALRLKLAPQIICWLNTLWTMWCEGKRTV